MIAVAREFLFATLAWFIPFAVSVCVFPLKQSYPPLFQALMGITVSASTVVLGCAYLRRAGGRYLAQGVKIGLLWMAANWAFDSFMFSAGPMQMNFAQYALEIGAGYLMIPIITIGLAAAARSGQAAAGARATARPPARPD